VGFEIQVPTAASLQHRAAFRVARPLLDWALGLPTYRRLHQRAADAPGLTFAARALQTLDIDVVLERGDLATIPATGPLLVVSNHPHGMLDGLALAHLIHRRRDDVRVLTSHLLAPIEDLADLCLFVDPFGGRSAAARSRAGLRAARKWLDAGRTLVVFPSGSVAHARTESGETATDSPWHGTAARLALATRAEVVPAFIRGGNSAWFYRAGYVHERLRTLLLGRELLNHRGRPVSVRLGRPLSATPQAIADDPLDATARFRRDDLVGEAKTVGADDFARLAIPDEQMQVVLVESIDVARLAGAFADGSKRELAQAAELLESQRHGLRTGAIDVEPPAAHQKRLAGERLHFGLERVR